LFKTFSALVFDIDACLVEVEVAIGPGEPGKCNVVGLSDNGASAFAPADLARSPNVEPQHLSEAIRYRTFLRRYWAWSSTWAGRGPWRGSGYQQRTLL
jgi:hypothetical protein